MPGCSSPPVTSASSTNRSRCSASCACRSRISLSATSRCSSSSWATKTAPSPPSACGRTIRYRTGETISPPAPGWAAFPLVVAREQGRLAPVRVPGGQRPGDLRVVRGSLALPVSPGSNPGHAEAAGGWGIVVSSPGRRLRAWSGTAAVTAARRGGFPGPAASAGRPHRRPPSPSGWWSSSTHRCRPPPPPAAASSATGGRLTRSSTRSSASPRATSLEDLDGILLPAVQVIPRQGMNLRRPGPVPDRVRSRRICSSVLALLTVASPREPPPGRRARSSRF